MTEPGGAESPDRESPGGAETVGSAADLDPRLLALARDGDIEALVNLVDRSGQDPELAMYRWCLIASDFGHEEADEFIDVLHTGPLHADDDQFTSGHAHFEVAVGYLTGDFGLPVDFAKARAHVHEMRRCNDYPDSVQNGDGMLAEARERMTPHARAVWDAALAEDLPDIEEDDDE
jgi:hypothetical protein